MTKIPIFKIMTKDHPFSKLYQKVPIKKMMKKITILKVMVKDPYFQNYDINNQRSPNYKTALFITKDFFIPGHE